ncbi:hypothetical protein PGN35_000725 [Nodosilinea sp. PGN35]|uniref:hypothetical protein n=1 Tax=Nodosilinea sp. PGN35 TaxID=3020489 RepID=UPI0023B2A72B|nr:hypothetical protein [Nodosilinea sp. TSF1-S3]MDF0369065.1 hypothetical protein [Nodosilinea sp. TSF1-S3]
MLKLSTLSLILTTAWTPLVMGLAAFSPLVPTAVAQVDFEFQPEALEPEREGLHAVYVDTAGNLLGTFVVVPGARLRIDATGQVEIDQRDFTTEATYFNDGRLRTLGDARFAYAINGRIRSIHGINFNYFSNGRLRAVGNTRLDYSRQGRLQRIADVSLDYDGSGTLRRINQNQTRDGIRIVVVN